MPEYEKDHASMLLCGDALTTLTTMIDSFHSPCSFFPLDGLHVALD